MILLFWIILSVIVYAYIGYFLFMWIFSRFYKKVKTPFDNNLNKPSVSLIVAAYNEQYIIPSKLENTNHLDYPAEKIEQIWVIDGSCDDSFQILSAIKDITLLHQPERTGKINAINRAVPYAKNDILIFSDANSMLSENSIREIVSIFDDASVGCVAGSKKVVDTTQSNRTMGEGAYWKYEALLKQWESLTGSTIGAAGELFAIRRELFESVEADTLLDDFVIASRIALKGFTVKYARHALACESQSASIADEMKRKIRIAAGGFQTMFRIAGLHNIAKHPGLTLKYWSHKVLRWFVVPFCLPLLFVLNLLIILYYKENEIYIALFIAQIAFYIIAFIGRNGQSHPYLPRWLFFPYYFVIINYCQILGFVRYIKGKQSVNWEKAARA